jgi:hypothetical protein
MLLILSLPGSEPKYQLYLLFVFATNHTNHLSSNRKEIVGALQDLQQFNPWY